MDDFGHAIVLQANDELDKRHWIQCIKDAITRHSGDADVENSTLTQSAVSSPAASNDSSSEVPQNQGVENSPLSRSGESIGSSHHDASVVCPSASASPESFNGFQNFNPVKNSRGNALF